MILKLTKYFVYPILILHVFIIDAFGQSPSSPMLLHSPYEPIVSISAGLQRGWGVGNIGDLNHWGAYGVADFTRYKFQMAVGVTENESFQNSLSINSGISFSLRKPRGVYVLQPALFTGVGYTKIYTSADESYDMINIPFGVSVGLDGPIPGIDLNISLAPKIQYRYLKIDDGEGVMGVGANIGVLYTPGGKNLGIKAGYELLNIKRDALLDNELERSFLIGIEYLLK